MANDERIWEQPLGCLLWIAVFAALLAVLKYLVF